VYVPDVELHQAATLDEAATLLARYGPTARLLAGGTDLLVDLKTGRVSARHLVSLKRIDELRGISKTGTGLRIGALTTIAEIERSALVREEYPAILDAASQMAARQIRNMATTGGNIACGVPCADLPPILTAMNASLALWSPGGEREVRLETFHTGARETVLRSNEVLTAIRVPQPPARFGAAYARFAQRDGNAIAVAGVAASLLLDGAGSVREGRVVLNAVAPTPKSVHEASRALAGRPPKAETFRAAAAAARAAAEPITDVRGSADFRRELVEVLTRRALERALERAMGAAS
jgi:carbon-monoxide dehydrogenase medium subunit